MVNVVGCPRIICKLAFYIGQVLIEKYGVKTLFLLINILEIEIKVFYEGLSPSDQANPFAYSCSFT